MLVDQETSEQLSDAKRLEGSHTSVHSTVGSVSSLRMVGAMLSRMDKVWVASAKFPQASVTTNVRTKS